MLSPVIILAQNLLFGIEAWSVIGEWKVPSVCSMWDTRAGAWRLRLSECSWLRDTL